MVTDSEWNTLRNFYAVDYDIVVMPDPGNSTLICEPGEYVSEMILKWQRRMNGSLDLDESRISCVDSTYIRVRNEIFTSV